MSFEDRRIYFDRAGAQITHERYLELHEYRRYVYLRITETGRYRVDTVWDGSDSALMVERVRPPLIFRTTTLAPPSPREGRPPELDRSARHTSEDEALEGHDRAVEEAEAKHPKQA